MIKNASADAPDIWRSEHVSEQCFGVKRSIQVRIGGGKVRSAIQPAHGTDLATWQTPSHAEPHIFLRLGKMLPGQAVGTQVSSLEISRAHTVHHLPPTPNTCFKGIMSTLYLTGGTYHGKPGFLQIPKKRPGLWSRGGLAMSEFHSGPSVGMHARGFRPGLWSRGGLAMSEFHSGPSVGMHANSGVGLEDPRCQKHANSRPVLVGS